MNCPKCGREYQPGWICCPFCGPVKTKKPAPKRGNKQGSVYKRGNTWTARITRKTFLKDGKVYQQRTSKGGFPTKAAAVEYIGKLQNNLQETVTPTLQSYWEAFKSGRLANLSDSKQTAYRIAWGRLSSLASREIRTLTVAELQRTVNREATSYYTARDVRVLLNHLYKLAEADGNANSHLPELIEIPKLEETAREPFTADEQKALWKAYEDGQEAAAYPLIMIYTGMMTGELLRLKIGMIDWEKKEIRGVGLKTKTRKMQSVLLPDTILPVLQSLAGSRDASQNLIQINKDNFYVVYYAALEQAGVRKLTPYCCRHTTATALAIDENIAPQTVRRVMRWSTSRMLDRYAHPDDADARAAVDSL